MYGKFFLGHLCAQACINKRGKFKAICTDITRLKRHEGALAAALEKAKLAEAKSRQQSLEKRVEKEREGRCVAASRVLSATRLTIVRCAG